MNGVIIAIVLVAGALGVAFMLKPKEQPRRPDAATQIGTGVGSLLSGILAAAGVGGSQQ